MRNWVYADGGHTRAAKEISSDYREELARLRRRVRVLERERDILETGAAWFAKGDRLDPLRVLELIDANQALFDVAVMCRTLGVSTSGYYGRRTRPPWERAMAG